MSSERRSCRAPILVVMVMVVAGSFFGLGATPTWAQDVRVYATYGPEDRGPGGPIGVMPDVSTTVHLWVWGGDSPSVGPPCNPGEIGSEICGVSFVLSTDGGFQLLDFTGDTNFDSSGGRLRFSVSLVTPDRLSANGFDLGVPTPSSRHLGTLALIGVGTDSTSGVDVLGDVVGANLEMRLITSERMIVPEPSFIAGVAVAMVMLVAAARVRGRARRSRVA